jgi:hypothetical protein
MPCFLLLAVAACSNEPANVAQFWRPISEPNLLMSLDTAQHKLNYDISQCHCGIYPLTTTRDESIDFQNDKQRLAQTGVTVTPDKDNNCSQQPSLVVSECMRQRGWEQTNCSGRMPLPGGGSLCAAYTY